VRHNPDCDRCPLGPSVLRHRCVWGRGNKHAPLMLVGEAPGFEEDLANLPFVGQAGKLLDHVLNKLGIEDVYITNVLKCHPPQDRLPCKKKTGDYFEQCRLYLDQEVRDVNPKVVVLLGGTALSFLAGERFITKWEGMEIDPVWMGIRTFVAFHPAYVLRVPSKEVRLAQAIARAAKAAGVRVRTKGWEGGRYDYDVRT